MAAILLVEPDARHRNYVARALFRAGYAVTATDTCAHALVEARFQHFDLALLNVMAPTTVGLELADQLKHEQPGIRILFMSGRSRPVSEQEFSDFGFASFHTSPFNFDAFREFLRRDLAFG